jgi:hypothetical protein
MADETDAGASGPAPMVSDDVPISGEQLRGSMWAELFRSKLLLEKTQQLAAALKALSREK